MSGKVDEKTNDGEQLSAGRREVLTKLALGGAYVAPVVLAGMLPTKAAAASTSSSAPASPPFIVL